MFSHGAVYYCASVLIVKTFYHNGESYAATVRPLCAILGHNEAPNELAVCRLMRKFNETGSTVNIRSPGCRHSGQSEKKIVVVHDNVAVGRMKSVFRHSQKFLISL